MLVFGGADFNTILAREDIAHLFSSHLLRFSRCKPLASNGSLDQQERTLDKCELGLMGRSLD